MPKFLEEKLRAEYGNNPHAIYGTMNKIGAMHGNKETAKGKAMEKKHEDHMREMRIEIHRGKDGEVSGHTVHHHMMPSKSSKSGAFMEETHHSYPFGPKDHSLIMKHIAKHLSPGPVKEMAKQMGEQEAEEDDGE